MSFVLIELPKVFADTPDELPSIVGELTYALPDASKPKIYAIEPPPGEPRRTTRADRRRVRIRDARALADPPSLDREGFTLVDAPSALATFDDDVAVRTFYYPEVERLLRRETGAAEVVIFDHTLRSDCPDTRARTGMRDPVRFVHNDYTHHSGRRRVGDHLDPEDAARWLDGRHAVVNVWRPIGDTVRQAPLAVCDARSIASADLIPTDLVYADRVGEVYSVRYDPRHRWYYYPAMRPDEVLLLKTYDSLEDGTARFSAHSAFDDPFASELAPPRASIEVRALLSFPDRPRPTWRAELLAPAAASSLSAPA